MVEHELENSGDVLLDADEIRKRIGAGGPHIDDSDRDVSLAGGDGKAIAGPDGEGGADEQDAVGAFQLRCAVLSDLHGDVLAEKYQHWFQRILLANGHVGMTNPS